jgi:hypothetical protein
MRFLVDESTGPAVAVGYRSKVTPPFLFTTKRAG